MRNEVVKKNDANTDDEIKKLFSEHLIARSIRECVKGSLILILALAFSIYAGRNVYEFPLIIMHLKMAVIVCFAVFSVLSLVFDPEKSKIVQTAFFVAMVAAIGFSMAFSIIVSISIPEYSARATQVSMAIVIGCMLFAGPIRESMGKILFINLAGFIIIMIAINGLSIPMFFDFYVMIVFIILVAVFNRIYTDSLFKEFVLNRDMNEKLEQLKSEIEEKEFLQKKLVDMASFDALTKLFNRRQGLNLFQMHFAKAIENNLPLTICYMDIDNLKEINDKYGHSAGDRYILDFIDLVRENIRETDFCIRLGGDEFLIVFPQSSSENVEKVWDRIISSTLDVKISTKHPYGMSASHGTVSFISGKHRSFCEMIDEADGLMYKEKALKRLA